MDFDCFKKAMLCKVQLYLGNEYEASLRNVSKNNGVTLCGIMAEKKGENACPTFYIDDFYEPDMNENDVDYAALTVSNLLKNAKMSPTMSLDVFDDFEKASENITVKLINADRNKELLLDVPHRRIHNLALVYCYVVPDVHYGGHAAVTITNSILKGWDVDERTLFEISMKNRKERFPSTLTPMKQVLEELRPDEKIDVDLPMYLISNEERVWGASAMLDNDILNRLGDIFDSNYFILPCSIHELIAIKTDGEFASETQRLLAMVTDVNCTQVEEQEYLADSVYYYDRGAGEVLWVC